MAWPGDPKEDPEPSCEWPVLVYMFLSFQVILKTGTSEEFIFAP